jgi:hypothetical protein
MLPSLFFGFVAVYEGQRKTVPFGTVKVALAAFLSFGKNSYIRGK